MGRVVLATMGSWGDIFPVIGLANGLTAAGHDVRVAASGAYDELVQGEGLQFSAIGPAWGFADYARDPKILSGRLGGFVGFSHLFRRFIFPALDRYVDDLAALDPRGRPAVGSSSAHRRARRGRARGGPVGNDQRVSRSHPDRVRAAGTDARGARVGSGRVGRAIHRAAWRTARFNLARLFDPQVNRARRRLGLRAVSDSFFAPVNSGQPYLVMASPAVIDRPADWPQNVTLTGFVIWDRGSSFPDPDGLEEFLSIPDRPVLVTLGASSSLDPQHFYRHATAAVTSLGHRALVLTGPTPTPVELPSTPGSSAPRSLRCPGSPPAARPPSTTAGSGQRSRCSGPDCLRWWSLEALTSPRPRIRMTRLGVARTLPWRRESAKHLTGELSALLSDDRYRRNVVAIQARLTSEDGLSETVRTVDLILRG